MLLIQIKMNRKTIGLWVPLLLLFISLILNIYFSKSLYILGQQLIFSWQQFSSPLLDAFFIFFTFLVEPYWVIAVLFITLILYPRKFQGFVITIAIFFNTYLFLVMKAFLNAPRPYWTRQGIKSIGYYCPKDYGSPSGHTQFAVFIFSIYLIHFNKTKNLFTIIFGYLIIIMVMISRMYLGGHSLDQVIFGFIVASAISIAYEYGGLRSSISKFLLKFNESGNAKRVGFFIVLCQLLNIYVYYKNLHQSSSFTASFNIWKYNFTEKCSFQINSLSMNEASLITQSILLSSIFGYFFSFQSILKEENSISYLTGKWHLNTTIFSFFSKPLFLILTLITLAFPIILFYPLYWLCKQTFVAKYLISNLIAFIIPYCFNLAFKFSKYITLIQFPISNEESKHQNKQLDIKKTDDIKKIAKGQ